MEPFTWCDGDVLYLGKWHTVDNVPDAVVDAMVSFLEKWEARHVGS